MSNKVQDLATKIAAEVTALIESTAQERIQQMLSGVMGGVVATTKAARSSVKAPKKHRNYVRKPCPVTGCKELAAPRHSMVCVNHKDLTQREKDQFKAQAMAPGGVWYKEEREKAQRRAAKKAA